MPAMVLRPLPGTLLISALAVALGAGLAAQAPAGQATPAPGGGGLGGRAPAGQATPALTVSGTPANDTVKGAALLTEARKALGGEDKLAAIKRLEPKGSITRVADNQALDGALVRQIKTPEKRRIEKEITPRG